MVADAPSSTMTTMAGWTSSLLSAPVLKGPAGAPRIAFTRTIGTAHSPTSPKRQGLAAGGQTAFASEITTTTDLTISSHLFRAEPPVSQQRRRHLHRCHQASGPVGRRHPLGSRLQLSSTTTAMATSISSFPTTCASILSTLRVPGENAPAMERHSGELWPARTAYRKALAVSQQW